MNKLWQQFKDFLDKYKTPSQIALQSLLKNKVRTFLSVLGVVIGISAVIIVLSVGQGIKGFMVSQLTSFGTDFIQVEVKVPNAAHTSSENVTGLALGITVTTLKDSDRLAIMKLDNIKNAYSATIAQDLVSYQDTNKQTMIFATSASYIDIDPVKVAEGRFFTDDEDMSLARVVILGPELKTDLFGDEDPIGKEIKIHKSSYRVIGVMGSKGSASFINFDTMIYMPLHTAQKLILGVDYVPLILAYVYDNSISELTAADITSLMRERHGITDPIRDDFAVTTQAEAMAILDTIVGAITLLLIAIAGISLVVGGIGIMNIMYVSVAERTFEIGLRKAVGAKKKDILDQFLLESIFITFAGGIIGIIFGILFALMITLIAKYLNYNFAFVVPISSLILASGVSIIVGLLSGYYPARSAASLDPIVALGKE
jgi:putative ABC transport system permease protein